MKAKRRTPNLDFYNNRHHIIYNTNSQTNDNISESTNNDNTSYTNGNSVKLIEAIGSSYLVTNKNFKSNTILQKIKLENDKIRKKYFNIPTENSYKLNFNSFNDNYDTSINNDSETNENKNILRQKKRKKILLKTSFERRENNGNEKSEKRKKRKKAKDLINENNKIINFDSNSDNKLKEIIKRKLNKTNEKEKNKPDDKSGNSIDNSEEIYIYNGCDNFIIREQNKNKNNIILNNKQKNEIIYQYMINSEKNLLFKNKRQKKSEGKVYKKKITKNSLSLSRKYNKDKQFEIKRYDNKLNNHKKIKIEKYMPLLNESNKKYFKINDSSFNSPHINNNSLFNSTSRTFKVYKKPNQINKINKTHLYKTYKVISNNNFYSSNSNSFYSIKNNNKNENDRKIKIKKILYSANQKLDLKHENNNKNNNTSNELKDENDNISYINSNTFSPQISLNNMSNNFPNFSNTIETEKEDKDKEKDKENTNENPSLVKEKVDTELLESDTLNQEINLLNNNSDNNQDIINNENDNTLLHLPISEYNYFTKENKLIIHQNKNIDKTKSELKFLIKRFKIKREKVIEKPTLNNNNYIPIKNNEEKNNTEKVPYSIPKEMVDKLNKKTENNNNLNNYKNDNKKNVKESYSIDAKKITNNNNLNKIFNDNILRTEEEINNEKNKRYKIRSVVKVVKKNKNINILNKNNITNEEKNKIIEKIKSNTENTKQDQIHNDKIKTILKEEIENYVLFYTNNNKDDKDKQENITEENKKNKNYDWSIIEQLIIKVKVDLIDIINCFLLISNEIIDNKNKLKICNEYIRLIIKFYKQDYLNENNIETIHIKILKILYQTETICINNKYKYEILGNLFQTFLIEKIFSENDLDYFENEEEKIIIEIAKIVKFIIIYFSNDNDKKIANDYYNKFKNTKIFNKNIIYFNYVTKYLKFLLDIKQDL